MDEAQWLACRYAGTMIWSLFSRSAGGGRIKDERYRRFGIACCRRALGALPGGNSPALELLEDSIETGVHPVLPDVRKLHQNQMKAGADGAPFGMRARQLAAAAVLKCAKGKTTTAAMAYEEALYAVVAMKAHEGGWSPPASSDWRNTPHGEARDAEYAFQATLVRDIFHNPFRSVEFAPDWRTDTVVALARQMYESHDFSAMPILADALQDAGCDSEDVLTHCRDANQPHVRGCWVVDLVLSKR
jgi:hypothetical protein